MVNSITTDEQKKTLPWLLGNKTFPTMISKPTMKLAMYSSTASVHINGNQTFRHIEHGIDSSRTSVKFRSKFSTLLPLRDRSGVKDSIKLQKTTKDRMNRSTARPSTLSNLHRHFDEGMANHQDRFVSPLNTMPSVTSDEMNGMKVYNVSRDAMFVHRDQLTGFSQLNSTNRHQQRNQLLLSSSQSNSSTDLYQPYLSLTITPASPKPLSRSLLS